MSDFQRRLVLVCACFSALFGWFHETLWLVVPPLALGTVLAAEVRAVRRRIGTSAWPSEGFARFLVGTNLSQTLSNAMLHAAIFAIAAWMSPIFGG